MATVQDKAEDRHDNQAAPLLDVRDLKTYFRVEGGVAKAVDGVSFKVFPGEVLGIVGESGSGKSVTALSVMRLVPDPPGFNAGGEIVYEGTDLLKKSYPEMWQIRGNEIAMIFQEPMTALNPVFNVGFQIIETIRTHNPGISKQQAFDRAVAMLKRVRIPDAAQRMKQFPHQFSGGMRQRAMIAIALCCNPQLLIADEPTTALDVTTQAQILDLMLELKHQHEGGSIILITHDLAVVAETCDRVIVMYGGKVQEVGTVEQIFRQPQHPYTKGLLDSLPSLQAKTVDRLHTIPGNVPSIMELPTGCKFCTRCEEVMDRCHEEEPVLHDVGDGHKVRCHLVEK
ncbi:MAG: ABC transporter ATP-binding protein [Planctomycetota bacterium]|nr:ABC transporter ATP-binding protein [Planctomycetota bacterium]